MNVLVIDKDPYRSKAIGNFIREHAAECSEIFRLHPREGQLIKEMLTNREWGKFEGCLPRIDLRLRHAGDLGDELQLSPQANLNVTYGGHGAIQETRHKVGEYPLFKAMQVSAGEVRSITPEELGQLTNYALGISVIRPDCLLPPLYDRELEKSLEHQHSDLSNIQPNTGVYRLDQILPKKGRKTRVLILWNRIWVNHKRKTDDTLQELKRAVCSKLISAGHAHFPFFAEKNEVDLCLSEEDLSSTGPIYDYDLILICAELAWRQDLTAFEGIYHANQFRGEGYRGLILMVSHAPWQTFLSSLEDYSFRLLRTPYFWFYPLSGDGFCKTEHLEEPKMSDFLLQDIQYYTLDPKGILHHLFHNLKLKIGLAQKDQSLAAKEIQKITAAFFNEQVSRLVMQNTMPDLLEIRDSILEELSEEDDRHPFYHIVLPHFDKVLALLPTLNAERSSRTKPNKYCVLHVEDDIKTREIVKSLLEEQDDIRCISVDNGADALARLRDDAKGELTDGNERFPARSILLLLVDYRLHVIGDQHEFWQPLQGYDLIRYVDEQFSNPLAYAILTNNKGAVMRQARRRSPLEISWFSKESLLSEISKKLLYDEIVDILEDTYRINFALSGNEVWNYGSSNRSPVLKEWYRYYQKMPNKKNSEELINRLTYKYLQLFDAIARYKSDTNEVVQKAKAEIFDQPDLGISTKFLGRFEGTPEKAPEKINAFLTRLLGRRVVIAVANLRSAAITSLADSEDMKEIDVIHNILRFGELRVAGSRDTHLFKNHLALPPASWTNPKWWLSEEQEFLIRNGFDG